MTTSTSLPSATSSSSSSHIPQSFSTMAHIHSHSPRTQSATSHLSAGSGRDSKIGSILSNESPTDGPSPAVQSPGGYGDHPYAPSFQQQPRHHLSVSAGSRPYLNANPSTFLPQITSSPPPHLPTYVPPPQHAMAPDPLHLMSGGMGVHQGVSGSLGMGNSAGMGQASGLPWQNNLPSWRNGPPHAFGNGPLAHQMPNGELPGPGMSHILPPNPNQGFPQSRISMSMPPGMLPPPMTNGVRPSTTHGEHRDRRRERAQRDDEGREDGKDSREEEVITTIFVVGFPDDLQEREFQNLFTFAPGFEAATLKFPSGSIRREPTAALLAELTQIAACQSSGDHLDGSIMSPLEEALAALQMGGAATGSSSTTPSAAMSLTPSAPSGPFTSSASNLPQLPTRRQTIGFARFRTRPDALAAKEQLQGRKIDTLTGATLKAEMAKKNLHTKRTTSGEELVGLLLRSGRLAGLMAQQQAQVQAQAQGMAGGPGVGGGRLMLPNGLDMSVAAPNGLGPQPPQSAREAWDSWTGVQLEQDEVRPTDSHSFPYPSQGHSALDRPSSLSNPSASPSISIRSPQHRATDSKALLALAEEVDEMEGWSVDGGVSGGMGLNGYRASQTASATGHDSRDHSGASPYPNPPPLHLSLSPQPLPAASQHAQSQPQPILSPRAESDMHAYHGYHGAGAPYPGDAGGLGYMGGGRGGDYGGSPPGGSDHLSDSGRGMLGGPNPADQNPPINTLYVGNLPAISPPTHPPNFLEESLRALFSRCHGFKRMSFRQKINGPMCFVEFEHVQTAAQAIKDMYGHNLGGLVKGGIRLSYSKNSLGQRGSAHPSGNINPIFGGIAHTVALAGMSSPSNNGSNNQAYGLQLQHGPSPSGSVPGPQSAPIPVAQHPRDSGGLSPDAQPFQASLPLATSPRNRYFGTSPSSAGGGGGGSGSQGKEGFAGYLHAQPGGQQLLQPGQFSPVSSPIRTPASFSWVSSGNGAGGVGNGYGFEAFSPTGSGNVASLNGAAAAWGQAHPQHPYYPGQYPGQPQ